MTREVPVKKAELARIANVSTRTIDRRRKDGLPYVLYGKRSPRFYVSQCLPWLAQFGRNQRNGEGA